jgi:sugar lactone lactonase YvrE
MVSTRECNERPERTVSRKVPMRGRGGREISSRSPMPGAGLLRSLIILTAVAGATSAVAQPPTIPLQRINGPVLDVRVVDPAATVELPAGLELGQVASVAFDARGHLFVLHRGDPALLEFDPDGRFVRAFGDGEFNRAHGLTIDARGGFWVTDVGAHTVMRLDDDGHVLTTLGTPGESGIWDEATGAHLFDQPNDVAIGPDGSIFVSQGHSRGEPRLLKFDAQARFVKSWGGRGTYPWEFAVAHSIVIDESGLLYVADRENRRIQVYDLDGEFVKGWVYRGMACSLALGADGNIYMTTGFDAQIVKLDRNGRVLGVTGQSGDGPNEYGEAHDIAVNARGEIIIADVVHRRLQKLVLR